MFYQIQMGVTAISSWLEENKTRDEAIRRFVCPFVNREVTIFQEKIFNMSSFGYLSVIETEKPVDSDWPVKKSDYADDKGRVEGWKYQEAVRKELETQGKDVTQELYREAVTLLESGQYQELRQNIVDSKKGRYSFFVCPFDDEEVDHNFEFVIRPAIREHQFDIERASDVSHTRTITDVIVGAINRSRFVIADLTNERPNCYYEVGYAHSIGKPVIILAKEGTPRHFDLSTHKWNYWTDYKDLKPKIEKELAAVLKDLGVA